MSFITVEYELVLAHILRDHLVLVLDVFSELLSVSVPYRES